VLEFPHLRTLSVVRISVTAGRMGELGSYVPLALLGVG
jgi:hypothetical protein